MIGFMSQNCARTCRFCPGDELNGGKRTDTDKVNLLIIAVIVTLNNDMLFNK